MFYLLTKITYFVQFLVMKIQMDIFCKLGDMKSI